MLRLWQPSLYVYHTLPDCLLYQLTLLLMQATNVNSNTKLYIHTWWENMRHKRTIKHQHPSQNIDLNVLLAHGQLAGPISQKLSHIFQSSTLLCSTRYPKKKLHLNFYIECLIVWSKHNFTSKLDHSVSGINTQIEDPSKIGCLTLEIHNFSLYFEECSRIMHDMWCWNGANMNGLQSNIHHENFVSGKGILLGMYILSQF